jgi:hypothetical protein
MHANDIAGGLLQSPREAKMVGMGMGEHVAARSLRATRDGDR